MKNVVLSRGFELLCFAVLLAALLALPYAAVRANQPPTVVAADFSTPEDQPLTATLAATDPDDDPVICQLSSPPGNGQVEFSPTSPCEFTYTPNPDATGIDLFYFRASDPSQASSNVARAQITITAVNDPPTAQPTTLKVKLNTPQDGTLLATDVDGDALRFAIQSLPALGSVEIVNSASGRFRYTPRSGVSGTDTFTFSVIEAQVPGSVAANAAVNVSIASSPNRPPIAEPGFVSLREDETYSGRLRASDADGDTLTFELDPTRMADKGLVQVVDETTGAFTYTPDLNAFGADVFFFRVGDGSVLSQPVRVEVDIRAVNDAPSITWAPDPAAVQDVPYAVSLDVGDDDGDALTVSVQGAPAWLVFDAATRRLSGTPGVSNVGTTHDLVATVSDGELQASTPVFTLAVVGVAPVTRATPSGGTFNTTQFVQLDCQAAAAAGACATFYSTNSDAQQADFDRYDGPPNNGAPIAIAESTTLRFYSSDSSTDETVQSADFVIDRTPPELTISEPVAARFDTFPNVKGVASDAGTGIESVSVRITHTDITQGVLYLTQTSRGPQVTPVPSSIQIAVQPSGDWQLAQLALPPGDWPLAHSTDWPPGQWSVTAEVADGAGNRVSRSVLFDYVDATQSAFTRLSLAASSPTVKPGGELRITGQLSRLPESGVSMADRALTVTVRRPDGSTLLPPDARTDDDQGHFAIDLSAMLTTPGRHEVQVDFAGTVQLDPSSATLAVLVGEQPGYAIIVQGRLDPSDQSGLLSHKLTTDRVHTILESRGFGDDNIRYLRFVPGDEGFELKPTSALLRDAITNWAFERLRVAPAPLFVVFVGHAGPAELLIDGADTVSPADLKGWLEDLETKLEAELNDDDLHAAPRIMVLGGCYTESFIADLSAAGRVLIASAGSSEESYRGPLEDFVSAADPNDPPIPLRTGELFVELLFKQLALDQSLPQAYEQARALVEVFTQRGGVANTARFLDSGAQHSFYDDNADGLGTNRITKGSVDGVASAEVHLGIAAAAAEGGAIADDAQAHFVQVTPTLRLGEGRDEAQLFAIANDPSRVAAAWAEVRSPSVVLQGQGGTIQLDNELHKEPLILEDGRYQARCTIDESARQNGCFSVPGRYEVFYFARDTLTGAVSALQRSLVYVDRPGNRPPDPFELIRPIVVDDVTPELAPSIALDWSDAVDPDGDSSIVYNVEIARNAEFTDALQRYEDLGTSALALGPQAGLIPGQTYHWRVTAVDRYGATRMSEQAAGFTVTDGPQQGIVRGVVYARASARPIANAQIALAEKTIATGSDGRFLHALPPGPVTLLVEALGFNPQTVDGTTVVEGAEQALAVPLDASDLSVLGLNLETDEDTDVSGQVQGGCGGSSCTFEQASSPKHGSLVGALNAVSGAFTYRPNADFNGTDRFRFYLRDSGGRRSSEGTVTVVVRPRNDAPILLSTTPVPSLPRVTLGVGNPTGIRVSALLEGRVQDADSSDPRGIAITSRDNSLGEWQYSLDGGVQWRPVPFSATIAATLLDAAPATRLRFRPVAAGSAQLEFRAWDQSSGATTQSGVDTRVSGGGSAFSTQLARTTVAVDAAAGFPLALGGEFTVPRGGEHFGALSASGAVGDTNRRFQIVSFPRKGELSLLNATTGEFRYSADSDSAGSDSFGFAVYGAAWQSNTAVVGVAITAVNRAPSVEGGSFSTRFDRPLSIQLRASDADGDPLSYAVTPTTFPDLQCGTLTALPTGSLPEAPILTYTPSAAGACDENPVQLTVSDGVETTNATLTFAVTDLPNQPPVANAVNFVTAEDRMFRNALTGSSDPPGKPLVFEIVSGASKGQVTLLHPVTGRFSYTPNLDAWGPDSFTFRVRDAGNVSQPPTTVGIDITPIDDPPRISGTPPPTVDVGGNYAFTPDAQEPDNETPVFSFENCPSWADCDTATGAITSKPGSPGSEHEGVWRNVTIRVTDGKSVAALPGFDIAVLPDSGAPEIVRSTADGAYNEAQQVELTCYDAAGGSCEIFYTLDDPATSPAFSASDALRAVEGGGLQIRGEVVGASTGVSTSGTYALSHVVGQPGIVGSANSRHYRALAGAVSADSDGDGTPDIYDLFPTDSSAYLRYTAPIEVDESATLRFFTRDEGGNRGEVASASYAIDRTAPEITITAPGVAATVQRILWIGGTVADAGGAGIAELTVEIKDETQYLTPDGTTATPTPLAVDIGDGGEWLLFTGTVPWQPDTVYSITARARDAAGNESVASRLVQLSNNPVQRPTLLSLELSARRVLVDDTFSVLGKLTRLPDSGLSLAGRPIVITVFEPDGSPLFTTTAQTRDELGNYLLQDLGGFVTKGPHRISARFADTELLAASEASATLHVASAPGVAILVQGKRADAAPHPAHALALNRLRTVLLNRGISDADINYLGYGSGPGIDGQPTRANVENAIRQWAKARLLAKPAPLLIALVGYGESERFAVDSATITPLDLAAWMTALEKALPAATLTDPRTLLLAANRSGSFLPSLSAPGRIVVTSTSAEGSAYQGPEEPDGARTASRFLNELGIGLAEGRSMASAYNAASAAVRLATRAGGDGGQTDEARQQPRLDDNGDGKGSAVLADLGLDGQIAAQSILGIGRPVIRLGVAQVTDTLSLADDRSSAGLWARLGDGAARGQPWVTIRARADRVAPASTDLQGILALPRVAFPSFNAERERWELTYDGFDQTGLYEIAYHVLDERDGSLSAAARSLLYRDAPGNVPPGEFVLLAPADDGERPSTTPELRWSESVDPDGDPVTYSVEIAEADTFSDPVFRQDGLMVTATKIAFAAGLRDLTTYYWRVTAVDRWGAVRESEPFQFTTDNSNGNAPALQFTTRDASRGGKEIPFVDLTLVGRKANNATETLTDTTNPLGTVTRDFAAGTVTVTATPSKAGYNAQPQQFTQFKTPPEVTEVDVSLTQQRPPVDLTVTLGATPALPRVGESVNYTVSVTNKGPQTATCVCVTSALVGFTVNAAPPVCSATPKVCSVSNLAPNVPKTLPISATASTVSMNAWAEVSASAPNEDELNPADNTAMVMTSILPIIDPPPDALIPLRAGLNLVSLPVLPQGVTTARALLDHLNANAGVNAVRIERLDAANRNWLVFDRDTDITDFPLMPPGAGYALTMHSTQAATQVPLNGDPVARSVDLAAGVNLLGVVVQTDAKAFGLMSQLGGNAKVTAVAGFDSQSGRYVSAGYDAAGRAVGANFAIERGRAYYVMLRSAVPNFELR